LICSLNLYKFNLGHKKKETEERLYRCQVWSKSFDIQINCPDHIKEDHNQPTPLTSNGVNEKLNILTNLHVLIILFYF